MKAAVSAILFGLGIVATNAHAQIDTITDILQPPTVTADEGFGTRDHREGDIVTFQVIRNQHGAGGPPPGHGRCSFDTRRGTPARDTLGPKRGAMQALSGVRITRTGDVRWHATAPIRARPRAGHASLAGTAPRVTPPSACCPTAWPRGCLGHSMGSKRSSSPPSRPRPAPRRPMRYAPMRSDSPERCAGSSAGYGWSITS